MRKLTINAPTVEQQEALKSAQALVSARAALQPKRRPSIYKKDKFHYRWQKEALVGVPKSIARKMLKRAIQDNLFKPEQEQRMWNHLELCWYFRERARKRAAEKLNLVK